MTDLFDNEINYKIRTLGFYQPFGSLMLHGKVETRWVRKGKKPPFPLGKYLFYTTKKECSNKMLSDWSGWQLINAMTNYLGPKKPGLNGSAIAIGELFNLRLMTQADERIGFVKFIGEKTVIKDRKEIIYVQWCLEFKDVKALVPFEWKFGKQGVGFVPLSEIIKIKIQ